MKRTRFTIAFKMKLFSFLFALSPLMSAGQQNIVINMAAIDGVTITPTNIFDYQVQASRAGAVQVKGIITYRNSNLRVSYSFSYSLRQGMNSFGEESLHPQWQFSSPALQDLFFTYNMLPAGTFEYCVTITPSGGIKEPTATSFDECLYHTADDLFLINLIEPENKAKLKEYNPLMTWVANYSFSNELTYRIRVAAIQQGQNPVNAVMRNQPVYDESNLVPNTMVYPVYGTPLLPNQPYAWTVDAYYKGILLGGSETWQFIIPADTLVSYLPATRSYIDIKRENGTISLYALGELKLKYILDNFRSDSLSLQLMDAGNKQVAIKPTVLKAAYGDNRYILDLKDSCSLKDMASYNLIIKSKDEKQTYTLPFKYLNPDTNH